MMRIIPMTIDDALKAAETYRSPVNGDMVGVLADEVKRLRADLAAVVKDAQRSKRTAIAYQEAYRIAHAATYQGHYAHVDMQGTAGANCRACIRAREERENCDAVLKEALSDLADAAISAGKQGEGE